MHARMLRVRLQSRIIGRMHTSAERQDAGCHLEEPSAEYSVPWCQVPNTSYHVTPLP